MWAEVFLLMASDNVYGYIPTVGREGYVSEFM